MLIPVSTVIPTRNRHDVMMRMLNSLAQQSAQPVEMIVVDASTNNETEQLCQATIPGLATQIIYQRAIETGAAAQRNQAMGKVSQEFVLFCDDDILFEEDCLIHLWKALQDDKQLGGINAMITNQRYLPPGQISRLLFQFLYGQAEANYAGKCIGPALCLLPEDNPELPEVVPVEWLNTTCTLYRQEALPNPLFPANFTGYSFMEDVTLSLTVGKQWKLANVRTARIFHDSQPGDHKSNLVALARMQLVNRHYVMTHILKRCTLEDYWKLAILELFGIVSSLRSLKGWRSLPMVLIGKLQAILEITYSGQSCPSSE